jgi:hypothetical protein
MTSPRYVHLALVLCPVFAALAVAAGTAWSPAAAATFTFTRIADSTTEIPGSGGKTFGYFRAPAIEGGLIAFLGQTWSEDFSGVYLAGSVPLATVADSSMPIPGGSENFARFRDVSLSSGQVAFQGGFTPETTPGEEEEAQEYNGVFVTGTGGLVNVADSETVAPESGGRNFVDFSRPSLDAGALAFSAQVGIFAVYTEGVFATDSGGSVVKIADASTPIADSPSPGELLGGTFFSAGRVGNDVIFLAATRDDGNGIFRGGSAGVTTIVRSGDPMPSVAGGRTIGRIGRAIARGSQVAFDAVDATLDHFGVYLLDASGIVRVVADSDTTLPGETEPFEEFQLESVDAGAVVFVAYRWTSADPPTRKWTIFTTLGGGMSRVLGIDDMLDGKALFHEFLLGPQALSCPSIALAVFFADPEDRPSASSAGVYRADIEGGAPCTELGDVDVGIAGGGFKTTARINLGKCRAPCTKVVDIKLKNFGSLTVPILYSVVAEPAGAVLSPECSGATSTVAPGKTAAVAGCTVSYFEAGDVMLRLSTAPGLGEDVAQDNNVRTVLVTVRP